MGSRRRLQRQSGGYVRWVIGAAGAVTTIVGYWGFPGDLAAALATVGGLSHDGWRTLLMVVGIVSVIAAAWRPSEDLRKRRRTRFKTVEVPVLALKGAGGPKEDSAPVDRINELVDWALGLKVAYSHHSGRVDTSLAHVLVYNQESFLPTDPKDQPGVTADTWSEWVEDIPERTQADKEEDPLVDALYRNGRIINLLREMESRGLLKSQPDHFARECWAGKPLLASVLAAVEGRPDFDRLPRVIREEPQPRAVVQTGFPVATVSPQGQPPSVQAHGGPKRRKGQAYGAKLSIGIECRAMGPQAVALRYAVRPAGSGQSHPCRIAAGDGELRNELYLDTKQAKPCKLSCYIAAEASESKEALVERLRESGFDLLIQNHTHPHECDAEIPAFAVTSPPVTLSSPHRL